MKYELVLKGFMWGGGTNWWVLLSLESFLKISLLQCRATQVSCGSQQDISLRFESWFSCNNLTENVRYVSWMKSRHS